MDYTDSFVNAAMIVSGMGPMSPLDTPSGKLFAEIYAIACSLLIVAIAGLILAPLFHRLLHRFHVDEGDRQS